MEQHAVPQDITGFQFKLVGDMTLKQFGELAGGVIVAYLFFASNWHPLLKWPLTIFFCFLGIALAFLPIEERPLDVWIANFLKAIYQPTYYVWKKDASGLAIAAPSPQVLPKSVPPATTAEPEPTLQAWPYPKPESKDEKDENKKPSEEAETVPLPEKTAVAGEVKEEKATEEKPLTEASVAPQPAPLSVEELQKLREQKLAELSFAKQKLEEKTQKVKSETYKAQNTANIITVDKLAEMREKKTATTSPMESQLRQLIKENTELLRQIDEVQGKIASLSGSDKEILQTQLLALNKEKDSLAAAITNLQQQVSQGGGQAIPSEPSPEPPWATGATGQMRIVDRPVRVAPTISLTDVPNMINGTVSDQRGAPMDGVILIIKDKAGNSVRALKTNRIGQFIVSTPLESGTYYLEFERPNYEFNVYELVLSGQVITPLEIRGKYREASTK